MKKIARYIFVSRYTLLLTAAVLFFLSYIFNTFYTNVTSVPKERKFLETYIHEQQRDFASVLKDTVLLRRLIQQEELPTEFKDLVTKKYGIFIYAESVSGDFNLLFWNDQIILPKEGSYNMADGEYFQKLNNGQYVVEKRSIKLKGMSNNVIAFAMIPVHYQYFIETDVLPEEFAHSAAAEQKILIVKGPTENVVRSVSGNPLFYLERKANVAIVYNDTVTITLRLGGLFLLLLFIHLSAESVARNSRAWKAVSLLAGGLILLRVIMYQVPELLNLRQFDLFDPGIYGSNVIQKSLGDLLINAIVFCWIVVFAWSKIYNKSNFKVLNDRRWKWVVGALSLFLLIFSTFLLANTIRSMVADSKISFNVIDFESLDRYSVIGFIVLACLSLGYYYFTQILFRLIFPVFEARAAGLIYFAIGVSGLIYLTMLSAGAAVQFYLFTLAWLVLYTWLVSKQSIILTRFQINIAGILFWIFIFSASISGIILKENQDKEWQRRRDIAEKYSAKFDVSRARELSIAMKYMDNNFLSTNFYRFYSPDSSTFLRESLVKDNNIIDYESKYDVKIYAFDYEKRPLNNEWPDSYEALNTIIANQSKPVDKVPDLYSYETFNKIVYITRKEVNNNTGAMLGYVFIVSTPKKYGSEALLPQLFKQTDQNDPENSSSIYSYAFYSKNELVASSSKYPFLTSLTNAELPKSEVEKRTNGSYDEMWYKDINEKVVVISRKKDSLIESITLFSWIFCSFLFMVTIVQLVSMILKAGYNWHEFRNMMQMSIRTQVHATIIAISLLSFIIIGVATISFFYSRFDRNNTDKLSRTMKVMVNEMQKKLLRRQLFNDTIQFADSFYSEKRDLEELVNEVAEIHNVDVNVYNRQGDLEVSSEANVYKRGILSTKMNPEAFYHLSRLREVQHVQQEKMGKLSYTSIYAPVRNEDNQIDRYLNIPYFTSQSDLNQEISNFLVTLINLNAFTFLIAGVIALFITNRITRSFSLISEKMQEVNLGKMNEEIVWNRDDEIGGLVKEYNKMVAKLGESATVMAKNEREGAWREMARQVAHEIKNPLTPMKLSIQYLQKAVNNNQPNVKELSSSVASTLIEQIDHLSRIAADFSQFANIGNVNVENFDLHDVIGSLKDLYEPNNKVDFLWRPVDKYVWLNADKTQMNRLFTNLFTNAIEACGDSKICKIEVDEVQDNGTIRVSIKDNGDGISPEMQSKIFVPNFTTKSSGTGLGLAMCKSIVEQAKGKIWFETERGVGTTFYVELPVAD